MKFLVLGSAGQIGGALCAYLQSVGHEAIPFDIASDPAEDLRKPSERLDRRMADCDFVFFLAFDVGGSTYLKTYQHTTEFIDNNARIMTTVFESLKKHSKPFIFTSSQMSNMSFSSYGMLKALGEFYTRSLGGIIVKFWNVYGIEHDPKKTHVITDFVKMALEKKEIRMRTTGDEERQFLFADDCSKALLALAKQYRDIPRDKELHITSFVWTKIRDVADIISELCGGVPIRVGREADSVQQNKLNDPDTHILSIWKPETDLKKGIERIVRHYSDVKR